MRGQVLDPSMLGPWWGHQSFLAWGPEPVKARGQEGGAGDGTRGRSHGQSCSLGLTQAVLPGRRLPAHLAWTREGPFWSPPFCEEFRTSPALPGGAPPPAPGLALQRHA